MNKFKIAAIKVLEEAGVPLHYKDITQIALDKEYLTTDGKTPEASMNAQLITEVNSLGKDSTFTKTGPGTFSLNPLARVKHDEAEKEEIKTERVKVDSGFVAKAGEHFVASELLFRGFNASIMSVDVGMDVIATKENKIFSFQVKTANLSSTNTYEYDVRKVALERQYTGNVFYIFVMKDENGIKSVVILPAHKIDELIHLKAIKHVKSYDKYRVTLKVRKQEIYLGTLDNSIDFYWNNWDLIK